MPVYAFENHRPKIGATTYVSPSAQIIGNLAAKEAEREDTAKAVHKAVLDAAKCSSCGVCVLSCPHHAIEEPMNFCCAKCVKYCLTLEVPCEPARIAICAERCEGCGRCIPSCPKEAIHLEPATI